MTESGAPRSATITEGNPDAPRRIVVLHGYTGAPDEFHELAKELSKRLNAYVTVPLLPGHGTTEEDLIRYSLSDLITAAKTEVREAAQSGKPFAVIGHSFGGHLALLATEDEKPTALVLTVMPFTLRPPFSIPGMDIYARTRTFWDKELSEDDKKERRKFFYYKRMPGIALGFVKEANARIKTILGKNTAPILTIHNREDPLAYAESGEDIFALSGNKHHNKSIILEKKEHGLFYGEGKDEVNKHIGDFLEREFGLSNRV